MNTIGARAEITRPKHNHAPAHNAPSAFSACAQRPLKLLTDTILAVTGGTAVAGGLAAAG
ncbi:hypothetical protein ACI2L1_06135 [Streptomyces sp. NPDC019531]|uniref:hypothetical protein n=1 Tax=Streptomyces sp. NPDC019531 TaxID=3365062 RepID=UPI00384B0D31